MKRRNCTGGPIPSIGIHTVSDAAVAEATIDAKALLAMAATVQADTSTEDEVFRASELSDVFAEFIVDLARPQLEGDHYREAVDLLIDRANSIACGKQPDDGHPEWIVHIVNEAVAATGGAA